MILQKYFIADNGFLHLWFFNNRYICIRLDSLSGKIVTRDKVGGNIQHTGIRLGKDCLTGQGYIIHNHPFPGYAHVTTSTDYAQGQQIRFQERVCVNSPKEVLRLGLNHVLERRRYKLLSDNCQTLVNVACNNKNYSEDVAKWGGIALGCFVLFKVFRKAS